jgi:hypothetical protein
MNTNQGDDMNENKVPAVTPEEYIHITGPRGGFKTSRVLPEVVRAVLGRQDRDAIIWGMFEGKEPTAEEMKKARESLIEGEGS